MGPWSIRDGERPHYPGVAFEVLAALAERGDLTPASVVRGPGTGQFWARAGSVPGVARLVGVCHACGAPVRRSDDRCGRCGEGLRVAYERDRLGLEAVAPTRLSAFATDEELFGPGGRAPQHARPIERPPERRAAPEAGDGGLSPIELTLGQEVAGERRRTRWLMAVVGALLVMNVVLAGLVLIAKAR
jgi:predicted nucleic acid-binding Zn ribbon protein